MGGLALQQGLGFGLLDWSSPGGLVTQTQQLDWEAV